MKLLESIGRWLGVGPRPARESAAPEPDYALQGELLTERLAALELALEDAAYKRVSGQSELEFSREGLRLITEEARLFYLKNPLIKRAVEVQAAYVWAQGASTSARHKAVNAVVQDFLDDDRNRDELSGQQARTAKEIDLQVEGNLFFVFFTKRVTGQVRVRSIPFHEIAEEPYCNPDDRREVWFYKRVWVEEQLDTATGTRRTVERTAWHPDWRYQPEPGARVATIGGKPVEWHAPVYHVKVGGLGSMRLGVSEIYAALDWARAYKDFLEDWSKIVKSYTRFAWNMTTKGGATGIAAAKRKLNSTLGAGGSAAETVPSSLTGSMFVGTEGTKLEPIKTSGATTKAEDGRRLLLMVAAATGWPECYSADTEVLTDRGFMLHQDWKPGIRVACFNPETQQAEFREPDALRRFAYEGDMIHFRNQQTDILVTPNHRMYARRNVHWKLTPSSKEKCPTAPGPPRVSDGAEPKVDRQWGIFEARQIEAEPRDAGWRFFGTAPYQGLDAELIDTPLGPKPAADWARFLGFWISEGCTTSSVCKSGEFRKDGTPIMREFRRIMLAQRPGPVLEEMIEVLNNLGIRFTRTVASRGVVNLVIYNKGLFSWLRENCGTGSATKRAPVELLHAGHDVRWALYDALMKGDGGPSGGSFRYSTASAELADQMMWLASSLGLAASVCKSGKMYRGREHDIWRVYIRTKILEPAVRSKNVHRVAYSGEVFCFSVPHGIYVTRRNGKLGVQGNTFFGDASVGSLATAQSLDRPTELRIKQRQALWADILRNILVYVLLQAIRAPRGALCDLATIEAQDDGVDKIVWGVDPETGDDVDGTVTVQFPSVIERDVQKVVGAIVSAATLDGKTLAGTMEPRTVARELQSALGIPDVDEELDRLFPDGSSDAEDLEGDEDLGEDEDPHATEAARAFREFREACAALQEKLRAT